MLCYNYPSALNIWKLWKMVIVYHRTVFCAAVQPRVEKIKHLASPLARTRRYQSVSMQNYQLIPHGSKVKNIFIFFLQFSLSRLSLCQWKLILQVLSRYLSVCQNLSNIPNCLSAMAIFANWPWRDGDYRALIESQPLNLLNRSTSLRVVQST